MDDLDRSYREKIGTKQRYQMPNGTRVLVKSWAEDHIGIRVNDVYIIRYPEPEPRLSFHQRLREASVDGPQR